MNTDRTNEYLYLAQWLDDNGDAYAASEFKAPDLTAAYRLARAHQERFPIINGMRLNAADLVVERV